MSKKSIFHILFYISILINILFSFSFLKANFNFSDEIINNITTPITAIVALIFAYKSWKESNKNNKITKSNIKYELLTESISKLFDEINNTNLCNQNTFLNLFENENNSLYPFTVKFNEYNKVLSESVSILNKKKYFEELNSINELDYNIFSQKYLLLPDNINEYYNNKKIISLIIKLESNLKKSESLIKIHKKELLFFFEENFLSTFKYYLTKGDKKYVYSDNDNKITIKSLNNFDIPILINRIEQYLSEQK